jgi:threonine dehydrogenase-like Zn-dependent dehydrogenase
MKNQDIPTKEIRKMKELVYKGKRDVQMMDKNIPSLEFTKDIIVKITATTVCGSDLHLYNGEVQKRFLKPYTLGHESVGIVEDL